MSNMSYCRFRNTLGDFTDCAENITDALKGDERQARLDLVVGAVSLLRDLGFEVVRSGVTPENEDVTDADVEDRLAEVETPEDEEDEV